jgi:hypothetical protein
MRARNLMIAVASLTLTLSACGGEQQTQSDSVNTVKQSLELENGGLTMDDELPRFGLQDLDEADVDPGLTLPEPPVDPGVLPPAPTDGSQPAALPPPPCPHGVLIGKWLEVKNGYGMIEGKWAAEGGKVVGHLKGIYGKNLKGEGVFFAKTIGLGGAFVGLIKGRFENNFYKGRWFDSNGLKGDLAGIYGGGKVLGMWTAICPKCQTQCQQGFVPAPDGTCLCVPAGLVPCKLGQCPQGQICDICPPACAPGVTCAATCGAPTCVPLPTPAPPAPEQSDDNAPVEPAVK